MKKVYPAEWVKFHPYERSEEADRYYANLATSINKILNTCQLEDEEYEVDLRDIAIRLTGWFEDIISGTRIWTTFTSACKQRYGTYLPFYDLDKDYIPGEVNFEDIAFLIWHNMQSYYGDRVLNPENPGIQAAASVIYILLAKEYETAPENEALYDALYGKPYGPEDFYRYRNALKWFHFQSYFNVYAINELTDEIDNLADEDGLDDFIKDHDPAILAYGIQNDLMFSSKNNLMAFSSPEWMARMGDGIPGLETWKDVQVHLGRYFLYDGEDKHFVYLKDITGDRKRMAVNKLSLSGTNSHWQAGKSILTCTLVAYGGCWWQSGLLAPIEDSKEEFQSILEEEQERRTREHMHKVFDKFRKASKKRPFVILKSQNELKDFFTKKMEFTIQEGVEFPEVNEKEGCLVTATPDAGIQTVIKGVACIKSPDNPFYDKETAQRDALMFYANPEVCPYALSCYLQDHGMLPDAKLNSLKGEEYGREFLQQNRNFITDYFFCKYRKKDYPEDIFTAS